MADSFPSAQGRRWPVTRFFFRAGRRTLVQSLYLLTAPFIAAAGLLLVASGLYVAAASSLLPGRRPARPRALLPARWFADLERWRIATVRAPAPGADGAGRPQRARETVAAAAADRRARYFGAFYAWLSVQCARDSWTAHDQDVYRGPFDRRTAAPVLVIGNRWDPVTSYGDAVRVARRLPSSRLISSDSWGHTALLTSACVDNTTWHYLIHPLAPAPEITYCRGDVQPFARSASSP